MKKLRSFILLSPILFGLLSFKTSEPSKVFTITIHNVVDEKHPILIGVFNKPTDFPNKAVYKKYKAIPSGNQMATVTITDLEYGSYAVSMFQDKNSDSRLNTNIIGMPIEPYAFSNNFRPKFSAPEFKDCRFHYNERYNHMSVALIH